MGVVATHGVAHDAGRLPVGRGRADAHLQHRPQDAALHGLETVADVGDRSGRDDGQGVREERLAHLVGDGHVDDLAGVGGLELELTGHAPTVAAVSDTAEALATVVSVPTTASITPAHTLVIGAGDIGLGLAASLIEAGVAVTTMNRSGRSVVGADVFVGDLAEPASLAALPAADTVVFTTAPPGRDEAAYRLAYLDGPGRVLAALPAPPERVVLISTTGVHGQDAGEWVDEASPAEPTRPTARVVRRGEQQLSALAPTIVVRPAGIYGPGRARFVDRVRAGEEPVAADGTPRWTNRIHRDDLVSALLAVTTHPDPPATVIAVDDAPSPRDDVIRHLADRLGAPPPASIDVEATTGKRCRNTALRSLGWAPEHPTFREGYAALLR